MKMVENSSKEILSETILYNVSFWTADIMEKSFQSPIFLVHI